MRENGQTRSDRLKLHALAGRVTYCIGMWVWGVRKVANCKQEKVGSVSCTMETTSRTTYAKLGWRWGERGTMMVVEEKESCTN